MFSRIFIERPRFAMVISIVLTLAGAISVFSLPISLYPQVTPPTITVSATYPGASAEVIANTVGIPLEEAINGVEDMLYMDSTSDSAGSYQLTVTFKVGVDPDLSQVKTQNRVQQALSKLPADVQQQGVTAERHNGCPAVERLCAEQYQKQPDSRERRGRSQCLRSAFEHARLA